MSPPARMRVAILAVCAAAAASAASPAAASDTVVSLTFEGAYADQTAAQPLLAARGMPATFFVPSSRVGASGRLSWAQISALKAAGHEIGGNTATQAWMPALPDAQKRHELCDDRDALLSHGFAAVSVSYPYGWPDERTRALAEQCGYNAGLAQGALACSWCDAAERIPPADPFGIRASSAVLTSVSAATVEGWVAAAQAAGGGWLPLVFRHVCSNCGSEAITPDALRSLLGWLAARPGVRVQTVAHVVGGAVAPAVATAHGPVTVSLEFDDGSAVQATAGSLLADRGMRGTFFVNSARIGTSGYMSWNDLDRLARQGHEIGGHTLDHPRLTTLSASEQRREVCTDRTALLARGYAVSDFAYPYGDADAKTQGIVRDCGYASGRDLGGVACESCTYAETIPPVNVFATTSVRDVRTDTTLADLQHVVTTAQDLGGGWVQLVFHRICDGCETYSTTQALLTSLLDWLSGHGGVEIKTVREARAAAQSPPPEPAAPGTPSTPPSTPSTPPGTPSAPAADTAGPVISIRCGGGACPHGWSTVPLSVTLSATDAGSGVSSLRYTVDGSTPTVVSRPAFGPILISWPTTLRYRAWDRAGNRSAVGTQQLFVDTRPPSTRLSAAGSRSVARGGRVTLSATATDRVSAVAAVTFLIDGRAVRTDRRAPYRMAWRATLRRGLHAATAVATDRAGNAATSRVLRIRIRRAR